jgi:hypothetical protein
VTDYKGKYDSRILFLDETGNWSDDKSIENWVIYDQDQGLLTVASDIPSDITALALGTVSSYDSQLGDNCDVTLIRPPANADSDHEPETVTPSSPKQEEPEAVTPSSPKQEEPETVTPSSPKQEATQPENPFADVDKDDYFYVPVLWAVQNGITTGIDTTHFDPGSPCTRAEIITFLWRAAGKPEPTTGNDPFIDLDQNAYYYKAVRWAAENGIALGMGNGKFVPNGTISRAQCVTFLFRALGGKAAAEIPFSDVPGSAYYAAAVAWAAENGITLGTSEDTFSPDEDCLRAQIVTFLYRAYNGDK